LNLIPVPGFAIEEQSALDAEAGGHMGNVLGNTQRIERVRILTCLEACGA
jgi:hypothetical protein